MLSCWSHFKKKKSFFFIIIYVNVQGRFFFFFFLVWCANFELFGVLEGPAVDRFKSSSKHCICSKSFRFHVRVLNMWIWSPSCCNETDFYLSKLFSLLMHWQSCSDCILMCCILQEDTVYFQKQFFFFSLSVTNTRVQLGWIECDSITSTAHCLCMWI